MPHARVVVRAYRPLRELTDEELGTLDLLGDHGSLFADQIAEVIGALSRLATEELAERQLAQDLRP